MWVVGEVLLLFKTWGGGVFVPYPLLPLLHQPLPALSICPPPLPLSTLLLLMLVWTTLNVHWIVQLAPGLRWEFDLPVFEIGIDWFPFSSLKPWTTLAMFTSLPSPCLLKSWLDGFNSQPLVSASSGGCWVPISKLLTIFTLHNVMTHLVMWFQLYKHRGLSPWDTPRDTLQWLKGLRGEHWVSTNQ